VKKRIASLCVFLTLLILASVLSARSQGVRTIFLTAMRTRFPMRPMRC
jgi:hypothetical protein